MTLSMKNRIVKYDFVIDKLGMIPGDYAKLEELMMNTMCMGYLGTVQGVQGFEHFSEKRR